VYFRDGYFKVEITLGKAERDKYERQQEQFSSSFRALYNGTPTLHDGKWLALDVRDESPLADIIRIINIKRRPKNESQTARQ
jgi:hypothetical protein